MDIKFPAELPVSARREDIAEAIRDHQVVIVAGETGSGKTTQLPKICLALGRGEGGPGGGLIGHTQPRRIAARSVAERIAAELGTELGDVVGYQVRFTDRTSAAGRVKVMTDGILLAELQRDKLLRRYDTLIIDEAHERSLNIDFLLGYLKQLLPRRPDLKVVITSATIDVQRFAEHFARDGVPAPIVEVSGRTYPVEIRYRPLVALPEDDEDGEPLVRDQTEAIVAAVDELRTATDGDILVFLPGEREIRDTADVLKKRSEGPRGFDIVPLYSRLSEAEQHRVFEQHSRRRVVLATNVAETSLTVPGITAVIDTGVARISRYSVRTKVQRLPIEPISQASANQRSGRCGRIEAGIAIRLYSEEDFEARPEFTEPEILRTTLASVILQMTSLGLGDVARFGFVEAPDARNIRAGMLLLTELGAIKEHTGGRSTPRLTGVGRSLARLPIDPQLGRMLLEADRLGCLREVLVIASALSLQDPRERPVEHQARADEMHARFADRRSDFMAWLNLWDHVRKQQKELGSSAFRRMCRAEHLNYLRVREWQEFESQLRQVAKQVGLKPARSGDGRAGEDLIHQALIAGLLSHIGLRDPDRRDYLGARGARFSIFPGSGLFKRQPDFVVAAELVETSRLWGRQCAVVDPLWVERIGAHLVSRSFSEPHWSKKRAATLAHERVTLYGVPLVADRLADYGKLEPALARELFIRHALVYGEWNTRHRFLETNRALLEEAEELEHRARRRDLVVDEHTLFDFYDAVIPPDVVSGGHFDGWWKVERRERPDLLTFDPAMLVHATAEEVAPGDYPDEWREGSLALPLSYHFEPGAEQDGVRVDVPLATLNHLGGQAFSWHVPGLREELVIALLRSLPKQLRVNFVPAPNVAKGFLAAVPPGEESLTDALARHLRAVTGVAVPPEAWDWAKVPGHLRPTFRIVDEDGAVLGEGKDLEALKRPLRPSFEAAMAGAAAESGLATTGQTIWTFGTLEQYFVQVRAGHEVRGYPGLVDEGDTVGLKVFASEAEQAAQHRRGIRRLLNLNVPAPDLTIGLDNATKLALAASPYPAVKALLADCVLAAIGDLTVEVWDAASFEALLAEVTRALPERAAEIRADVLRVLAAEREVDRLLHGRVDLAVLPSMNDMRQQLGRLVAPGFVVEAGGTQLREFPRYLAALAERHRKLPESPGKDLELMSRVAEFQNGWEQRMAALAPGRPPDAALERLRWLVEEYRVSLWAQHLGTREPVSDKRLRDALGQA
ncbi:ATP-dependent RNA helicase HrpA [Nocardioides marmoriginsengisoli]|uniref:ATP-dependent RNA helicase HrpA n=1 Tax=Nocardioides marmoriginsengisoli TaxID=661483 RepID=A0A3N0CL63_9ACTN|nr:ATP-dependent RNA helicase HrpA [Nocardioides marmoriginsengisoli]